MTERLHVLTVCSYNRTRSVMSAAMLGEMLARRGLGDRVEIRSAGFNDEGVPPIRATVEAMSRRGIDVSGHRSTRLDRELLGWADLILTAEVDHVVRASALDRDAFGRTMTLPEFVDRTARAELAQSAMAESYRDRILQITAGRTAAGYLRDDTTEIGDPTGTSSRAFEQAVARLESLCELAAAAIASTLLS